MGIVPVRPEAIVEAKLSAFGMAEAKHRGYGDWARWYRDNIPIAEQLYIDYTADEEE